MKGGIWLRMQLPGLVVGQWEHAQNSSVPKGQTVPARGLSSEQELCILGLLLLGTRFL